MLELYKLMVNSIHTIKSKREDIELSFIVFRMILCYNTSGKHSLSLRRLIRIRCLKVLFENRDLFSQPAQHL